ncbi:MAG: hypothetical protein Q9183_003865 [Haloplaca sp. 2 TL-2023]
MATTTSTCLESLPAEIKLNVLSLIPNVKSLRAIVHASPLYHATYLLAREKILTDITLQELQTRKINVTTRVDYAEVCVRGGGGSTTPAGVLENAVQDIFNQLDRNTSIKLSAYQCTALLTLEDFKGYRTNSRGDVAPQEPLPPQQWHSWEYNFTCVTHSDQTQYLPQYGWRNYKILSFGPENGTTRFCFGEQLKYCHKRFGWREAGLKTREATAVRRAEKKRLVEEARQAEKKRLLEEEMEEEQERKWLRADQRQAVAELVVCGAMLAITEGAEPIWQALNHVMHAKLGCNVRLKI